MGLEFTFSSIRFLKITRTWIFFFALLELFLWTFETTLFGINFFNVNAYYYFIFALHSLHTVTWATMLLFASTGHGIAFDGYGVSLGSFAFFTDLAAAIAITILGVTDGIAGQLDFPSGAGRTFDIIVLILIYGYAVLGTVRLISLFFVQEASSVQRHRVSKFIKAHLGSIYKADQLQTIYRWQLFKKKIIKWLAPKQPIAFVAGVIVFFIQRFFLGEGFLFLVLPLIPLSFLWLFSMSAAGNEVFPPDGMTDISEIIAVAVANLFAFLGILVLMFIAISRPMAIVGPPFVELWSRRNWWVAFSILAFAEVCVLAEVLLLMQILSQRFEHREILRSRERVLTDLKQKWKLYQMNKIPEVVTE